MNALKVASLGLLVLMGVATGPKIWAYLADEPYCCQQDMGCCPGGACCNDNEHRAAQCAVRFRRSAMGTESRPH
jgi:hypothetical protein